MPLDREGGERLEVRDGEVGSSLRATGGTETSAVYESGIDAEGFRGLDIMVDALADVQYVLASNSEALECELKWGERGFVGLGLLGGDHLVEGNFEVTGSSAKEIVVGVGDDRQLVFGLEPGERGNCVGKGLPVFQGFRERLRFSIREGESQTISEALSNREQNVAVTMVRILGLGLEVAVDLQNASVFELVAMRGHERAQDGKDASLPIDQGTVAIEGEDLDSTKIERLCGRAYAVGLG